MVARPTTMPPERPIPCRTRAPIRNSIVGLAVQAILPRILKEMPKIIVRRRPYRSDNGPSTSMLTAKAARYATNVNCTPGTEVSSALAIAGTDGT